MADIKQAYAASTAITINLDNLAAARESTAIDNSGNKYLDAIVYLSIALVAGTPSVDKQFLVYFYGSEDGTNYTDNATGSDADITLLSPSNLRGPFLIQTPTGGLTYKAVIGSVAQFFGNNLPRKWGIVVSNRSGLNLAASGSVKTYTGVYATN